MCYLLAQSNLNANGHVLVVIHTSTKLRGRPTPLKIRISTFVMQTTCDGGDQVQKEFRITFVRTPKVRILNSVSE